MHYLLLKYRSIDPSKSSSSQYNVETTYTFSLSNLNFTLITSTNCHANVHHHHQFKIKISDFLFFATVLFHNKILINKVEPNHADPTLENGWKIDSQPSLPALSSTKSSSSIRTSPWLAALTATVMARKALVAVATDDDDNFNESPCFAHVRVQEIEAPLACVWYRCWIRCSCRAERRVSSS